MITATGWVFASALTLFVAGVVPATITLNTTNRKWADRVFRYSIRVADTGVAIFGVWLLVLMWWALLRVGP